MFTSYILLYVGGESIDSLSYTSEELKIEAIVQAKSNETIQPNETTHVKNIGNETIIMRIWEKLSPVTSHPNYDNIMRRLKDHKRIRQSEELMNIINENGDEQIGSHVSLNSNDSSKRPRFLSNVNREIPESRFFNRRSVGISGGQVEHNTLS